MEGRTARPAGRQPRQRGLAYVFTGLLLLGASAPAAEPPTVEQMLRFRPLQEGVACTTPSAAEQKDCKVELDKGKAGSGWVLKDGSGNLLRRFYDSNGDGQVDVWSYYKDGVEVYRELDTTGSRKPDQFRWLNSGGSKWGIDSDKDGRIDSWKVISAEEVSQEVLRALVTRDYRRLEALMITEDEVRSLGLPAELASQVRELRKGAKAKFDSTLASVAKAGKLNAKSTWLHLETAPPHCLPAEQTRARQDVLRHARGTVLVAVDGGSEMIQTGPMILSGGAWRLLDAPVIGPAAEDAPAGAGAMVKGIEGDPKVQKLVEELTELDKRFQKLPAPDNRELARHHLARADVLEKVVAAVKPADREPFTRQLADSLGTAAQASGDTNSTAFRRLAALEKQLTVKAPGQNLTAYVVFRAMQADYSVKIGSTKDFAKTQQEWMDKLAKFVDAYPDAEDAPDALLQLGMVCEFLGKDVEAKNWYGQVVKRYAGKPQGPKAAGAVRRLDSEGKPFELSGPLLDKPGTTFDVSSLRDKLVVVCYWASWNNQPAGDFAKLKAVLDTYGKEVALVCVSLDNSAEEAQKFLRKTPAPGTHLYQPGGLESKLATQYGVMVLPHLFLVGKDGKVLSRSVQIATLDDEVRKQVKK